MRKMIFWLTIFALVLSACTPAQVTTPPPTMPLPTDTSTPAPTIPLGLRNLPEGLIPAYTETGSWTLGIDAGDGETIVVSGLIYDENGFNVRLEDGSVISVPNPEIGRRFIFDADGKLTLLGQDGSPIAEYKNGEWVKALPPLPQEFLDQVPQDSYTYDANGLHVDLGEGKTIDIPTEEVEARLQVGEDGVWQILDAEGNIAARYENGEWAEFLPLPEKDLNPAYTETVSQKFMGVWINAELITDKSLDPVITKVTVPERVYAEFIARTIFKVWWVKGEVRHTGVPTEADFKAFMALWAQAQKSNDPADWEKVQINDIWANDLNDGNGYKQQKYTIWPMYSGETPEGVRGIDKMSIALVSGIKVKNITLFEDNVYNESFGTNLDEKTLYFYSFPTLISHFQTKNKGIASNISALPWWMVRNYGGSVSGYPTKGDMSLVKLLLNGGLKAYP